MAYDPKWTNGNAQGRLEPGVHTVCLADAEELAAEINRRRLLIYQWGQDFSSGIHSGAPVRKAAVATASAPPFDSLRYNFDSKILTPPAGVLGGEPPTPAAMDWLWPVSGDDEDKILVSGFAPPAEGQVGLFQKLNGTNHWTDQTLTAGGTFVRAVHFNELRQADEWIIRGKWRLPIYFSRGIFSLAPDTPWIGEAVANNGTDELRSLGFAIVRTLETPSRGLNDVTVRSSSRLEITADRDCTVGAYHCLRMLDFTLDPPTWNKYRPNEQKAWGSPGGTGGGDSSSIGSIDLVAETPGSISNSALSSALQAMVDGSEQVFLLRRTDSDNYTVSITGQVTIEFELNSN